jgi:hypothetical protein
MSPAERVDPEVGRTGARFAGSDRVASPTDDGETPPVHADPAVGLTGARFGGGSRRRRAAAVRAAEAVESWAAGADEVRAADASARIPQARRPDATEMSSAAPARTGASPSAQTSAADLDDAPAGDADEPQAGGADDAAAGEADGADAPHDADDAPPPVHVPPDAEEGWIGVKVRPYVRTGGRTRPAVELALEALVSVAPGAPEPLGADHHAVAELCASPRSVAEIAALLEVPIGVARVLVGDLAQDGTVVVHDTSGPGGPDPALMQRVLDGLRRL